MNQTLDHGLILKKVHRVIKINQKDWLKIFIDINTKLRQKAKNNFEKDFLKLMNDVVFGETMENVRKYGDNKLVTTEKRRNYLVLEPNYHIAKLFSEHLFAKKMKKNSNINE